MKEIQQRSSKGYTNLVSQVSGVHKNDYFEKCERLLQEVLTERGMDKFIRKLSTEAKDIMTGWIGL